MSITDSGSTIIAAVIGAMGSGGVSLLIWWRQTKGGRAQQRIVDAWQKQAKNLDERLRKQYEGEIAYLKQELAEARGRPRRHE